MAEAGRSQQDTNGLGKKGLFGIAVKCKMIKDVIFPLQFIFTVLTGGTGRRLSSGEGGTRGPFGAYYTVCCSRGWTVSARITGYLPR